MRTAFGLVSVLLLGTVLSSFGEDLPKKLVELQDKLSSRMKLSAITSDSTKDDAGNKIEVMKINTYQDKRDDYNFRMRVTMQLTDKNGQVRFAQYNRERGTVNDDYTGEDQWEFWLPEGDLYRPKVTAYAIQYGVLEDGVFVPVAEKFSKVDSVEEITSGDATRIEFSKTLHSYSYTQDGETLTTMKN